MSTEYRRGIPSTAHVEAATRLGLLWEADDRWLHEFRFQNENVEVRYFRVYNPVPNDTGWEAPDTAIRRLNYHPIRPDGTPVDWEVLDQEVARVGQQGQAATVTPTTFAAPTTQPQGFRADLWQRIAPFYIGTGRTSLAGLEAPAGFGDQEIAARWTIYQELKPLYDLVDGAQGEAAMPRDVYNECRARAGWTGEADDRWLLRYNSRLEAVGIGEVWHGDGRTLFERANMRNFAAVLDAVAERWVAEAGFAAEAMRPAQEAVQRAANDATPARSVGDIEWTATGQPVTRHMTVDPVSTLPPPLPRFTADELDDVDHSKTTKLDEVTLRRGELPTVEQIAKYREVRARRTGGTLADALKESHIDCEVAQYVLERWASGLGDTDTVLLLRAAGCIAPLKDAPRYSIRAFDPKQGEVDRRSQDFLRTHNATLDTSEKPSPTVQRERQEAEERRQRLAELRQRLATERAAQPQEMAKESDVSRFDLIEPDPQADPAASIRAWEARQAAAKVRPVAAPPRIAMPAAVPRRPAIEVVDAEVDGLSRSEAFAALFGRALNGGC